MVLIAWLCGLVAQLRREVSKARDRGRAAQEKERKLGLLIGNMLAEEKALAKQILDQESAASNQQREVEAIRAELEVHLAGGHNRLLILSVRRAPTDREWIVTLVNQNYIRNEPTMPLAQEWAEGRDYLVFAKTDHDARERALRRFSNRPGFAVKAVVAAPPDLLVSRVE